MDDYLDSTNNENDAINLINDVIHVHQQQGSFEIRNWISSSQVVMESIPEQLRRNRDAKVSLDHENLPDRVLGILWDPTEDVFTFNVDFAKIDKALLSGEKKREILTIINSVFDPLGFVAHLMIVGKIILKNVWRTGIKWFFNPPTAASMGGAWERLVRSIKTALYATLNSVHPSDEVLATLLAEAQHVTNSRPLLEISDHPSEEETLTPNHFLIDRSSASAPIGEFDSNDLILKKQWRASQHLANFFWIDGSKNSFRPSPKRSGFYLHEDRILATWF